jgi:hypothetical protein
VFSLLFCNDYEEEDPGYGRNTQDGIQDEERKVDQQQKTAEVHFNTLTMSEIEEVSYRDGLEEDDPRSFASVIIFCSNGSLSYVSNCLNLTQ